MFYHIFHCHPDIQNHFPRPFAKSLVFVVVRIELRVHVRIDVRIVHIGMHFLLVNLIIDFGDTIVIFRLTGFTNITCSCTRSFESVCVDFDTPFAFDINTFLRESQVTNVCVPFVTRVYFAVQLLSGYFYSFQHIS